MYFCRFAGLLLVTKSVKPEDDEARELVFNAVGSEFLLRLLLPLRQGRLHPKPLSDEQAEHQVYLAALGLSIVSNICTSRQVAEHESMVDFAGIALGVLEYGVGRLVNRYLRNDRINVSESTELDMLKDACACLLLIGEHNAQALGSMQSKHCCSILAKQLETMYDFSCRNASVEDARQQFMVLLFRCMATCIGKDSGSYVSVHGQDVESTLPTLAKYFSIVSDRNKDIDSSEGSQSPFLVRCHLMALHCLQSSILFCQDKDSASEWDMHVKYGMESILASRILETERYEALDLLSHVLDLLGVSWMYSLPEDSLLELVAQTVRVEIGVLILDACSPESKVHEPMTMDAFGSKFGKMEITEETNTGDKGKEPAVPPNSIPLPKGADIVEQRFALKASKECDSNTTISAGSRALKRLPVCYSLFEHVIEALSLVANLDNEHPYVSQKSMMRVFESVVETSELLLQFIEQSVDLGAPFMEKENGTRRLLLLSTCKAFCSFSAQNPHQFSSRFINILPKLLKESDIESQCMEFVLPTIVALLLSDHLETEEEAIQFTSKIVDPYVFDPLVQTVSDLTSNLLNDHGLSHSADGYLQAEMLFEAIVRMLKIASTHDLLKPIWSYIQNMPETFHLCKLLQYWDFTDHLDFPVSCLALLVQLHLILQPQDGHDLKDLLVKFMPAVLERIFLVAGTSHCPASVSNESPLLTPMEIELFDGLDELCMHDASFAELTVSQSGITLSEVTTLLT